MIKIIKKILTIGWLLIIIGALSNIVEKIIFGKVYDYLKIGNIRFNLADIFIVVGVIITIYQIYAKKY